MRPIATGLASLAVAGLAVAGLGHGAAATPPDTIDVYDRLLGISACCTLLLRTTDDNLGVYDRRLMDTVLVSIDRTSGAQTQTPVYRVRVQPDPEAEGEDRPRQIAVERLPGSVEPFEALAAIKGIPLLAEAYPIIRRAEPVREGETLVIRDDEGAQPFKIAPLMAQIGASLNGLAKAVGEYPRLAPVTTALLLADRPAEPASCVFSEALRLDDASGAPPVLLVRATCDVDIDAVTSVLVALRQPAAAKAK